MSKYLEGPLAGVRVIELGTMIAGPFSATLLADFGAEVIKIEQPGAGDPMRQIGPFSHGESLWWNVEARSKRSMTLDLHTEDGREILRGLVSKADVLIENFRPGTMDRWGLGWKTLSEINPRLVMCSISGYGQTGPYSQRPAYDRMAQAFAGILNVTGFPDRPPVRPGVAIADYGTAVFAAFAIMMAIYHRDARGGNGQHIDTAMYEAMFRLTDNMLTCYDRLGTTRSRSGNLNRNAAPGDHFLTADNRYLVITVSSDALFARLCDCMGKPELVTDTRYSTHDARAGRLPEINGIVSDWVRSLTAQEACARLDAGQQPYSLIYTIEEIAKDPHYEARGSIATLDHPRLGPLKMQGVAPRLLGTPAPAIRPAPELGEATEHVLLNLLGKSIAEVERLRAAGVV
jgi:formyl-CoA transferase